MPLLRTIDLDPDLTWEQHVAVVNSRQRTRFERVNGSLYMIVPMSILTPGVWHGSDGPLMNSGYQVFNSTPLWDMCPILYDHPRSKKQNNRTITANCWHNQGLGFLRDPYFSRNYSVAGDGWLSVDRVCRIQPALYNALMEARPINVSCSYVCEKELLPDQTIPRAVDLKPHHIALSLHHTPAIGIKDGVGVFAR